MSLADNKYTKLKVSCCSWLRRINRLAVIIVCLVIIALVASFSGNFMPDSLWSGVIYCFAVVGVTAILAWGGGVIRVNRNYLGVRQPELVSDSDHSSEFTLFDRFPLGIMVWDFAGQVRYINHALLHRLAITMPSKLSEIVCHDDLAAFSAIKTKKTSGGDAIDDLTDVKLIDNHGDEQAFKLVFVNQPWSNSKGYLSVGVLLDDSLSRAGDFTGEGDHKVAPLAGRLLDNAPFAIASVDFSGLIGQTNLIFDRLFDVATLDQVPNLIELVSSENRNNLTATLEAIDAGKANLVPVDATLARDNNRSVRFFMVPGETDGKKVIKAMVYALDITEQKALEIQFAQSQKMQAIGQLAGGIAHDFNNVLTAIIGNSDLLLQNHRPSDPAFFDIMNIKQNAMRAAGLVRQLLAFSRRQTLRPQLLNLDEVISDLRNMLARLLGDKVTLQITRDKDLWPVRTDATQFEQVIINLAVNARDAMAEEALLLISTSNVSASESADFGFSELPGADYVLIEVKDTGSGMAPEVVDKIFEPFFTTKEIGKGTGLGLSTVYGIIRQTGGFIFVTSKQGEGSSFFIFLPRSNDLTDSARKPDEHGDDGSKPVKMVEDFTGAETILLVEDEEAVRTFAARALSSRGYKVYQAATGNDAIKALEDIPEKIDLVVSDVMMPGMDGPAMVRILRKNNPHIKVIFVSGYAQDTVRNNIQADEKFHFLPKPFTLKDLAGAVKKALTS